MHCQEKGNRTERRASPTPVRRAGREEWRTSFCSNRSRERRVQQLSGSREERREQWVETLPRGGREGGEGGRSEGEREGGGGESYYLLPAIMTVYYSSYDII